MDIYVRPESHEIDTLARRRVPLAFPVAWEHRELTGRDYGIDMIIEVFENGIATGNLLSLQIKGTSKNISIAEKIIYDLPVRTLIYSDMFIAPVLLVLCPVNSQQKGFYYLWLQEYIRVILNRENPDWRKNTSKVRVKIPVRNYMPGDEDKVAFISNFPKRIFDWCQYARIYEDIKYALDNYFNIDNMIPEEFENDKFFSDIIKQSKDELARVIRLINEIINLKSIFADKDWNLPQSTLRDIIIPALKAAEELFYDNCKNRFEAKNILSRLLSVSHLLGLYNDYDYSRALWAQEGVHNF